MRFPSHPGGLAGLVLHVPDLAAAQPFLHGVLHALGYGRTSRGDDWILWARDGAQVLAQQAAAPDEAVRGVGVQLRAPSRAVVDALHARALAENWRVVAPPAERPYASGYYSVTLAGPEELGLTLEVVHALDDLPDLMDGGEWARLSGADGITLGGYLHRPHGKAAASVVVIPGYGLDAMATSWTAARLAREGFAALSLSQRGWLGSDGDEDQGLRQPDDALAGRGRVAAWAAGLRRPGCPAGLLARRAGRAACSGPARGGAAGGGRVLPLHGPSRLGTGQRGAGHRRLPGRLRGVREHGGLLARDRREPHPLPGAADPRRRGHDGAGDAKPGHGGRQSRDPPGGGGRRHARLHGRAVCGRAGAHGGVPARVPPPRFGPGAVTTPIPRGLRRLLRPAGPDDAAGRLASSGTS